MDMMQMAPYIAIGVVVLMAIIIVPLVLRFTRKKQKWAADFFPQLAQKTGLRVDYDKLVGNYKGFDVSLQYKLKYNVISSYKLVAGGGSNVGGKNAQYVCLFVEAKKSGEHFPATALYATPGLLSHTSQRVQDAVTNREPQFPKLEIDGSVLRKGIDVYGTDINAAQKMISSPELQQLLSNWKYTDVRCEGDTCKLALDNNSAPSTIGLEKMYTHEFAIQALDIAVAAAAAVSKN